MRVMTHSPAVHEIPIDVARHISWLSSDALVQPHVLETTPGTMQRRAAVRDYVVAHWPEKGCVQVQEWFYAWVRALRREMREPLTGTIPC